MTTGIGWLDWVIAAIVIGLLSDIFTGFIRRALKDLDRNGGK